MISHKKIKMFLLAAVIFIAVLVVGSSLSNSKSTKTFDYATSKQEKGNLLTKETSIRVFYKDGCPVCQKWQPEIVSVLNSVDTTKTKVIYKEISDGLPKEIENLFIDGTFDKAKTPYIVFYKKNNISQSGKLIPYSTIRVKNKESAAKFKKMVSDFTNK